MITINQLLPPELTCFEFYPLDHFDSNCTIEGLYVHFNTNTLELLVLFCDFDTKTIDWYFRLKLQCSGNFERVIKEIENTYQTQKQGVMSQNIEQKLLSLFVPQKPISICIKH